jgi:hypothetical protein
MSNDTSDQPLAAWLARPKIKTAIASQVTIRQKNTAAGKRTTVSIDHRLVSEIEGYDGWRITTKRTFLPLAHFSSWATHDLRTANHDRGRTIYCMDRARDDEVVAAISYHIDDHASWPIFITMIGLRIELGEDADLRRRTLAGAYLIKQYLHAVASTLGRPCDLYVDLSPKSGQAAATELGFRPARRIPGLRVAGVLMSQAPLLSAPPA